MRKLSRHPMWWYRPLVVESSNAEHHSEDPFHRGLLIPQKYIMNEDSCASDLFRECSQEKPVKKREKQDRNGKKPSKVWLRTKPCRGQTWAWSRGRLECNLHLKDCSTWNQASLTFLLHKLLERLVWGRGWEINSRAAPTLCACQQNGSSPPFAIRSQNTQKLGRGTWKC